MLRSEIRETVRSVALALTFSSMGFLAVFLLKKGLKLEMSKLSLSLIAFLVTSALVVLLFPSVFRIPFGRVGVRTFFERLGLIGAGPRFRLVALGVFASLFTLSGMLIGSLLTQKYHFSADTVTLTQAVFSLTPAIWEEILFRGVMMIVLLRLTRSYRKAAAIQISLFGLAHIKGLDALALVDAFSVTVIACAFTYIAYKTKSLLPGIVFHYLHDTFLFAVQLPGGEYSGFMDNLYFYVALWIMAKYCIFMVKLAVERFSLASPIDFYAIETGVSAIPVPAPDPEKTRRMERASRSVLLVTVLGFTFALLPGINESGAILTVYLALYVAAHLVFFIKWDKLKGKYEGWSYLLNAFMAFFTSYDFYSHGSERIWLVYIPIGFMYLMMAVVRSRPASAALTVPVEQRGS